MLPCCAVGKIGVGIWDTFIKKWEGRRQRLGSGDGGEPKKQEYAIEHSKRSCIRYS